MNSDIEGPLGAASLTTPEPGVTLSELVEMTVLARFGAIFYARACGLRQRCAMTGLRLTMEAAPEVEAAHIQPVAKDGPDLSETG